jgi:hypothetical protein
MLAYSKNTKRRNNLKDHGKVSGSQGGEYGDVRLLVYK